MRLADRYREEYRNPDRPMVTVADWLKLLLEIDPKAEAVKTDLGVSLHFSDGSVWLLGAASRNAACQRN
jgi:hypothetical protein